MIANALPRARARVARLELGLWPLASSSAYSNRVWLILVPLVVMAQVLSDVGDHGGSARARDRACG